MEVAKVKMGVKICIACQWVSFQSSDPICVAHFQQLQMDVFWDNVAAWGHHQSLQLPNLYDFWAYAIAT